MKNNLSLSKKMILELIRYKTHNNFSFFAGNDYIAKALDLTEGTVKIFVNELIKEGYLIKEYDKKSRRNLKVSDLQYTRLYADFTDVDKKVITMERDDAIRDTKYMKEQLEGEIIRNQQLSDERTDLVFNNAKLTHEVQKMNEEIETLKNRISELEKQNTILNNRVSDLENLFYCNNVSKEALENMIVQNTNNL